MGLFGKKEKLPDGIRVQYYDGELVEFPCNYPCQLLLMEDVLRITRIKPYVEVKLNRNRILNIEIFSEPEYMAKYRGTAVDTSKSVSIKKIYFVFNYYSKDGDKKHMDFWGTATESIKIMKMREELVSNQSPSSYEI